MAYKPTGRPRGRPKGSGNKVNEYRRWEVKQKEAKLDDVLRGKAFPGDAHYFLMSVYKDETKELRDRLTAAQAALPYEKPRLSAIEHSGAMGVKGADDYTDAELRALIAGASGGIASEETDGSETAH